jgi:dTDP-4-dehydrorhamnose 3,5-epimerase
VNVRPTELPGVLILDPDVHTDDRGCFFEVWQEARYQAAVTPLPFRQDSVSVSRKGVVRGLHFQHPRDQGKLVSVLTGSAWDVAVDVRAGSPTFGTWIAEELSGDNRRQLWIPAGFAHGFQALTDDVVLVYKATAVYAPECDRAVNVADPDLDIPWPIRPWVASARDQTAPRLRDLPADALPTYE